MERMQRPKEDRLGIPAAAWIGALGGSIAGAFVEGSAGVFEAIGKAIAPWYNG